MPKRANPGKKSPTGNYRVGYCKPPEETRFQPGKSGRPKKGPSKQNELSPIEKVMSEKHEVMIGGRKRKETTAYISALAQGRKAMNGNLNAYRFLMDKYSRCQTENAQTQMTYDEEKFAKFVNSLTEQELLQYQSFHNRLQGIVRDDPSTRSADVLDDPLLREEDGGDDELA